MSCCSRKKLGKARSDGRSSRMSSAASSTRSGREPWQTDTCIGNWHYDRPLYEQNGYKSARQVIQRLVDVVSKNGNLLLNIPVRGDGTIDEKEEAIVDGIARVDRGAMARRSSARGRGASSARARPGRRPGIWRRTRRSHSPREDVRFTQKGGALYAILLDWPAGARRRLRRSACERRPMRRSNAWICSAGRSFRSGAMARRCGSTLPPPQPGEFVPALRISGRGLA